MNVIVKGGRPYGKTLGAIAIFRGSIGALLLILSYWDWSNFGWAPVTLFIAAHLSDHLDGAIARRLSNPTAIGYLQDSIADKLLTVGCLLAISRTMPFVDIILFFVVCREFLVLAARFLDWKGKENIQKGRFVSVIYYGFLRASIMCFLLSFIDIASESNAMLVQVAYLLLLVALITGWCTVVGLCTSNSSFWHDVED